MFRIKRSAPAATLTYDRIAQLKSWVAKYTLEGGFNHVAAVTVKDYNDLAPDGLKSEDVLPGTFSVVVIASDGKLLPQKMREHFESCPGWVDSEPEPMDGYIEAYISRLRISLRTHGVHGRFIFRFGPEATQLPLSQLGALGGLGDRRPGEERLYHDDESSCLVQALAFVDVAIPPGPVEEPKSVLAT